MQSRLDVPIGTILDYAGNTIPDGYLECDGSAVSRTAYPRLFAAIGTLWGAGDGSTTFNLPDLRCRSAIGAGPNGANTTDYWGAYAASSNNMPMGQRGGQAKHTLTESEMPEHTHAMAYYATNGSQPWGYHYDTNNKSKISGKNVSGSGVQLAGGGVSSQHHAALRRRSEGRSRRLARWC